jgi:hypothetical protein
MITPKRPSSTAHAAALACAIALLAAACTSSAPAAPDAIKSASSEISATAYLSVIENYFPGTAATRAPGNQTLRFAVTDQRTIAQLAALFEALPTAPNQNIISPCPGSMAPAYELDFQDSKNSTPVAEFSIQCFGVMVSVHGQDEPILSDPTSPGKPSLLSSVSSLLAASMPHAG